MAAQNSIPTDPAPSGKINTNVLNAFLNATKDVIQMMGHTPVIMKEASANPQYLSVSGVNAVIEVLRPTRNGVVILSFPSSSASRFVCKFTGQNPDAVSLKEQGDVIGEFANMISGNAQTSLSKIEETPSDISPPRCILGDNPEISANESGSPFILLSFETDSLPFFLQVSC